MVELHWSVLACIVSISALIGFCVCALLTVASDADRRIEEMKK